MKDDNNNKNNKKENNPQKTYNENNKKETDPQKTREEGKHPCVTVQPEATRGILQQDEFSK
jgi:hypothetical protein